MQKYNVPVKTMRAFLEPALQVRLGSLPSFLQGATGFTTVSFRACWYDHRLLRNLSLGLQLPKSGVWVLYTLYNCIAQEATF